MKKLSQNIELFVDIFYIIIVKTNKQNKEVKHYDKQKSFKRT